MSTDWMEKTAQREGKGNKSKTKAAYYRLQRENAEEGGNQALTDKIYSKLGKKSHNVDTERGNKFILSAAPFLPEAAGGVAEMTAARAAGRFAPKAAKAVSKVGSSLAKRAEGGLEKSYQHLGRAKPIAKALTKSGVKGTAKTGVRSIEQHSAKALGDKSPKHLDNIGMSKKKVLPSGASKHKALPSGKHSEFEAELAKMTKKGQKMPAKPKTFNRNGTKRAEGRQKSERNPVSKRKKEGE